LIAMRVLLKAIGANPENGFTNFIYALSRLFVAPFLTMVEPIELSETAVFEVASVLAIFFYLILAWLLARLMMILFNRPATGVSATRSVGRRSHL
jgi:YggT family protein